MSKPSDISQLEVKIDRTKPTLKIEKTPNDWTNKEVTYTITAEDLESGIKSIVLPNNSVVTTSSAIFVVEKNDTYSFSVTNNADNIIVIDDIVNNIEDIPPTPPKENVIGDDGNIIEPEEPNAPDLVEKDWSNTYINLETKSEAPSGIAKYEYRLEQSSPSAIQYKGKQTDEWLEFYGELKLDEGIQTVLVRSISNAGNISIPSTFILKTDYTAPVVEHEVNGGKFIITSTDNLSGTKSIACEHGEVLGESTKCPISPKHDYIVLDMAGNAVAYSITHVASGGGSGSSGGSGGDYEAITKPITKPEAVPIPIIPPASEIVKPETVNPKTDNSSSDGYSSDGESLEMIKLDGAKKIDSTDDITALSTGGKHIIVYCLLFLLLLLLIIVAIIIYIVKKLKEKEDDSEDVW